MQPPGSNSNMLYNQAPPQNAFDSHGNNFYSNPKAPTSQQQGGFYSPQLPPQQQQAAYYPAAVSQPPQQLPPQGVFYNPLQTNVNNLFSDPVASMAVKYGSSLADQGKEYVAQNVDKWFSTSKLKYYFAVDTTYVAKKLLLILFPFLNRVSRFLHLT